MEYKIHDVDWTDQKVSRFWDFQNQYEPFEEVWFTRQVGEGIINFMKKQIKIHGTILDYGTGKGHLVEHLLQLDSIVYGFDFSSESVVNVDRKYNGRGNYKGTTLIGDGEDYTSFESDFFDVVFLIEAIEHLTDKHLKSTLNEINRILRKDGILVVTTPNSERLSTQHVLCPDCGAVFHRVQHMRSFNQKELTGLMAHSNFSEIKSGVTNFSHYNEISFLSFLKRNLSFFRSNYVQPHLWYIGKKA